MKESEKEYYKALSPIVLLTQLGIHMMIPIFLCIFIGRFLDNYFSKDSLFLIIFIILGCLAALRNMYTLIMRFYKNER